MTTALEALCELVEAKDAYDATCAADKPGMEHRYSTLGAARFRVDCAWDNARKVMAKPQQEKPSGEPPELRFAG